MDTAIIVAAVTVGVPATITAIGALWKAGKQAGRADEYQRLTDLAMAELKEELEEAWDLVEECQGKQVRRRRKKAVS